MGIIALLKISQTKILSILEQAGFIDELKQMHQMSVAEIAEHLRKSKSWVTMRLGLIEEMSETIRQKIFNGAFPLYSYMYTLRRFMRMKGVSQGDIEPFIEAVSGKKLSVRDIEQLAHGYFRGPESFREQIRNGNIGLALDTMRQVPEDASGCNEFERILLKDLEVSQKYMRRVIGKSQDSRIKTPSFFAQANLLTAGLLSRGPFFLQTVRQLHDRSGQT
jgi:DNA-binding Lrp family transcriptional regulator